MAQFGVIQQYIKSSLYSIQYFLAYEEFIKIIIMMNCDQWCQDIILVHRMVIGFITTYAINA
jgi:hypothetical protein